MARPSILYKYKSINTITDLEYLLDILYNNRVYFPKYSQLNDPLEGCGGNIYFEAWAGASITRNADEELSNIEEIKNHYGILSLTELADSPQLWAHYTNNYKGVCLCFIATGLFDTAKRVDYVSSHEAIYANTDEEREKAVVNNFYVKQKGWEYEKEWRCVQDIREKKEGQLVNFDTTLLAGIIIGNKLSLNISNLIINSLPSGIKVMKAVPGYQTYRINIYPWDYQVKYDGSMAEPINDIPHYLGIHDNADII